MLLVSDARALEAADLALLAAVADGATDDAIARSLSCGTRTLQRRLARLDARTGSVSRLEAVLWYLSR